MTSLPIVSFMITANHTNVQSMQVFLIIFVGLDDMDLGLTQINTGVAMLHLGRCIDTSAIHSSPVILSGSAYSTHPSITSPLKFPNDFLTNSIKLAKIFNEKEARLHLQNHFDWSQVSQ